MTGYDFHPQARDDLDEIWEFIRPENPAAADRVIAEILAAIRALVPFPNRGHRRVDLTSRPLRFIRVRDYLIAYVPDENPLWVLAVLHGRRSPHVLSAILKADNNHDISLHSPHLSPCSQPHLISASDWEEQKTASWLSVRASKKSWGSRGASFHGRRSS